MRKLTSLLLLFLCGMATSWADYEVGKLLTAAEVNAGVEQVCLFINQDQGIHFYITSEGTGSDDFVTTDKTCVFDFVKIPGGVALRNCNGQFVVNQMGTFALSSDQSQAATFRATQREDGVGNVVAPSSETVMLTDLGYSQNLNSTNISGSRRNTLTFNGGTGVWTCFRVFKVDSDEPVVTNVKKFTLNCARGYVYGTGSVLQGSTDASMAGEFALVPYGETTYLYDVTNKKFAIGSADDQSALPTTGDETVTKESATDFSRIITGVAIGETGLQNYPAYLYDKWGNYLNMDGERRVYFNTWQDFENGNGGNTYVVTETGDLDITEAVAMLDAYFNPSTTVKYVVMDPETEEEFVVTTAVANEGDVISDLPEQYKKDFCTYSLAEGPVTLVAGENTVLFDVVYDLPFVTEWGEEADAKWYYAKIRGNYYLNTTVTGTKAGAYYPSTTLDESDDSYQWAFKGNPYKGIRIYNKKAGAAQTLGESGDLALMLDGEHTWDVFANGEGFVLRVPGTSNKYVNQNGGSAGYLGYWESTLGRTDAGSTITLTEVPEPINVDDMTPVDATIDMTTGTFTASSGGVLGKTWESNESPKLKFECVKGIGGGGNNMIGGEFVFKNHDAGNSLGLFAGQTYQLSVESGYVIKGYEINGVNMDNAQSILTAGSDTHTFTTEESSFSKTFENPVTTTSFDVTGTQFLKLNTFTVHLLKQPSADITFIVYDNDNNVYDYATVSVPAGEEVNDIPESLKRDFTTYTAETAPFVVEKDKADKFEVIATFNLPFEVSTEGNEKWYYVKNSDKYLYYYSESQSHVFGSEAPNGSTAYHYAFFGNPYAGFTVKNAVGGQLGAEFSGYSGYVSTGEDVWYITANEDGFNMHNAGNYNWALYNDYLLGWVNEGLRTNAAGRFFVEAVPAPEAKYTEGEFNVTSLVDGKVLNVDENNLAMVENVVSGEFGCDLTANGNGTFTVGLPGKTATGQHHLHIGSGGNWSNGDATATTFYEVADPAAETLSAKAVESLTLGKTYVLVGVREGANYALSSTLVNAGDASKQRLAGVPATINEGELIMERDATILWTMGHAGEVEKTTGLTSGTYLFRNLAGEADKFLGVDVNLSVVDLDALVPTKAVTFSSPETGVFNLKLGGLAAYLSCGSNGRFSRNTVANAIRLFEVADVTADPFVATQVNTFKAGHNYLLVGAKSGADYALTAELYNAGQGDNQRMVGTAVTIEEGVISVAKDDKLVWTINEATRPEVVVFEPEVKGEPVEVSLWVFADDQLVEMTTFDANVGDVITELPEDVKKPFTEYTFDPYTVVADDNMLQVNATFDLPFETGKYYYVKLNGKYMQFDAKRNSGYMGIVDLGDFQTRPMTLEEIEAAEDAKTFHWSITGDPYNHFVLFNEGKQQYLTATNSGYTAVGEFENALLVDIAPRGEGLTFTTTNGVLVDLYDTYAVVPVGSNANTDARAVTTLEEVGGGEVVEPEVIEKAINMSTGEFTESNPDKTWAKKWESNDGAPAVSLTTTANNMAANTDASYLAGEGLKIFTEADGVCEYTIEVEPGYEIVGYKVRGNAYTNDITATDTETSESHVFTNAEQGEWDVTIDHAQKAEFVLNGTARTFLNAVITVKVVKLETTDVTFNVVDAAGQTVYTEKIPVQVGAEVTAIPESLVRPFCEYSYPATLVVKKDGDNVFVANVNYVMPFLTNGSTYNLKVNTRYVFADGGNAASAETATEDEAYQWTFTGNPYEGIAVQNVGAAFYLANNEISEGQWSTGLGTSAEPVMWVLGKSGEGFTLHRNANDYIKLSEGTLVTHNWAGNASDVSARMSVELVEEAYDPEKDYPINFDKTQTPTNASRWVSTVSIDDQQIAVSESAADNTLAYRDLREQPGFAVEAGQTVKPAVGYMAEWMHTYVYVDYDRDGQFKVEPTAITDGVIGEGQEIVSFSHYEGYNSAGEAVAAGNKTIDLPAFTIPADTKPGYYAMRFKVDWNSVDPAGNPGEGTVGSSQHIITNGGTITDVRLNVHGENVKVTSISNDASSSVALDDNTSLAEAVEVPFGQEIGLRFAPAEGKKVASFSVRHGYFNGDEYVHGVRQYAVEDVDGADVVRNRYYLPLEWCDGDIEISVVFDEDTGIQNINGLSNDDVIYGVDGRRMNQRNILNKGVYVINGKKVLVK